MITVVEAVRADGLDPHLLRSKEYGIARAYVLSGGNVSHEFRED